MSDASPEGKRKGIFDFGISGRWMKIMGVAYASYQVGDQFLRYVLTPTCAEVPACASEAHIAMTFAVSLLGLAAYGAYKLKGAKRVG